MKNGLTSLYKNTKLRGSPAYTKFHMNIAYLKELKTINLLYPYYTVAHCAPPVSLKELHGGSESTIGDIRGHMLGNWMSAAAQIRLTARYGRRIRNKPPV